MKHVTTLIIDLGKILLTVLLLQLVWMALDLIVHWAIEICCANRSLVCLFRRFENVLVKIPNSKEMFNVIARSAATKQSDSISCICVIQIANCQIASTSFVGFAMTNNKWMFNVIARSIATKQSNSISCICVMLIVNCQIASTSFVGLAMTNSK